MQVEIVSGVDLGTVPVRTKFWPGDHEGGKATDTHMAPSDPLSVPRRLSGVSTPRSGWRFLFLTFTRDHL